MRKSRTDTPFTFGTAALSALTLSSKCSQVRGRTLTWADELGAATVGALFGKLWTLYGDHIEAGDYSKVPGDGWGPIPADDVARIDTKSRPLKKAKKQN